MNKKGCDFLYIQELGKNKYRVFIDAGTDYKGKRKRQSKTFTAKTKKELNAQVENWKRLLTRQITDISKMTVADMCDEVFPTICQDKSLNTIKGYKVNLERIKDTIGDVHVSKLSPRILQGWISDLQQIETIRSRNYRENNKSLEQRYYSPKTIRDTYSLLRLCCSCAVTWDILTANPCHDVKLPIKAKKEAKILSMEDFATFYKNLDTLDLDTKVLFELALFCSLRRGEIMGLPDVDYQERRILVRQARYEDANKRSYLKGVKTPSGERIAVLPLFVHEDIKALRIYHKEQKLKYGAMWQDSEYLIKMPDGSAFRPNNAAERLRSYLKRIDLPHISFHQLRHTYASMCAYFGADIETISKRMGHANISTTLDIYTHLFQNDTSENDFISSNFDDFVQKWHDYGTKAK